MPQPRVLQGDIQSTVTTLHFLRGALFFCRSSWHKSTTVGLYLKPCVQQHFSFLFLQHINNTAACFFHTPSPSVSLGHPLSVFISLTFTLCSSVLPLLLLAHFLFLSPSPVSLSTQPSSFSHLRAEPMQLGIDHSKLCLIPGQATDAVIPSDLSARDVSSCSHSPARPRHHITVETLN